MKPLTAKPDDLSPLESHKGNREVTPTLPPQAVLSFHHDEMHVNIFRQECHTVGTVTCWVSHNRHPESCGHTIVEDAAWCLDWSGDCLGASLSSATPLCH